MERKNTELKRDPEAVAQAIVPAKTIALCSHVNPDGDTIGSTLALRLGLQQLGKQVDVFCQDKIPDNLSFMAGADAYLTAEGAASHYDLTIAVDAADGARLGTSEVLLNRADHTAQVDHHGTNPCYAESNDIDPDASATALLIRELLDLLHVTITREIAICLYCGISTDTGNFAFTNTTPEAFRTAADLLEMCDLPLSKMNRILFQQRSRAQTLLIGRALDTMTFEAGGSIAVIALTRKDMEDCGALPEHTETIVNYGLNVEGAKFAVMARELDSEHTKFSLRAVEPYTVDNVAKMMGGGGHELAAGCTVNAPLQAAVSQVVAAMKDEMNGATA